MHRWVRRADILKVRPASPPSARPKPRWAHSATSPRSTKPAAAATDPPPPVHLASPTWRPPGADRKRAGRAAQGAHRDGVQALLAAFHIPVTQTILAAPPNEAMMICHPAGLSGGAQDRLARHQPQVGRERRGAERHERHAGARHLQRHGAAVRHCSPDARINGVTVQKMASASRRGREMYRRWSPTIRSAR